MIHIVSVLRPHLNYLCFFKNKCAFILQQMSHSLVLPALITVTWGHSFTTLSQARWWVGWKNKDAHFKPLNWTWDFKGNIRIVIIITHFIIQSYFHVQFWPAALTHSFALDDCDGNFGCNLLFWLYGGDAFNLLSYHLAACISCSWCCLFPRSH